MSREGLSNEITPEKAFPGSLNANLPMELLQILTTATIMPVAILSLNTVSPG
jgi:hypothetical protein